MITRTETGVSGCWVIESRLHTDYRGTFQELYNAAHAREVGLPTEWIQDNLSFSKANVIRGLHLQRVNPQGKLVRCVQGRILDVCVDVRPGSKTFMKHHAELLTHGNGRALYCPPGTAHGFAVLSSRGAIVHYKCTTAYDPESDGGIHYDDPKLGVPWCIFNPIVSEKDSNLPSFIEYLNRNS